MAHQLLKFNIQNIGSAEYRITCIECTWLSYLPLPNTLNVSKMYSNSNASRPHESSLQYTNFLHEKLVSIYL